MKLYIRTFLIALIASTTISFLLLKMHTMMMESHFKFCQKEVETINNNMHWRTMQCAYLHYPDGCIESVNVAFIKEIDELQREGCDDKH